MNTEKQKIEKPDAENAKTDVKKDEPAKEHGGRGGLDPVRYGDWEKDGKCVDF